ncbi:GntR family transcriptional regulator [Blautia liquoris]|jgi:K+/H+ antiporter YhaU regulatory subunit KhtT|uniref:GntR family transcriptional regulator n=1 Tax=Blautia liquoris TaxID=2779518 RepID=A0A7M2RKQ9_9FIRM|nr:GntR family transcriptional regulator [Blautia liquoris]QOV20584.1 GntR family transcriptional regulator [Blautia liquoris]
MKVSISRYQQIAADVASKIADGYYKEGEKIYARSSLASRYGVSSETARRAINTLADMKIVDVTRGSGVIIASKQRAKEFVSRFHSINQMGELKEHILDGISRQNALNVEMKEMVNELLYKTERFQSVNPFTPFEIEITKDAVYIGESLSSIQFWHNTAATIIAIKRNDELILSPGPYAEFRIEDIVYYIGDKDCEERVQNFFYSEK